MAKFPDSLRTKKNLPYSLAAVGAIFVLGFGMLTHLETKQTVAIDIERAQVLGVTMDACTPLPAPTQEWDAIIAEEGFLCVKNEDGRSVTVFYGENWRARDTFALWNHEVPQN